VSSILYFLCTTANLIVCVVVVQNEFCLIRHCVPIGGLMSLLDLLRLLRFLLLPVNLISFIFLLKKLLSVFFVFKKDALEKWFIQEFRAKLDFLSGDFLLECL